MRLRVCLHHGTAHVLPCEEPLAIPIQPERPQILYRV